MSKPGFKVSGLIQSGRVVPATGITPSAAFAPQDAPSGPTAPVPGTEMMMRLDLLDDSPYQTRLKIDPLRVDAIGQSMLATRQVDPIEVRIVTPGRAEVVKGHTRKYSALSIGWEEARVLIVALSNKEAAAAVLIDNTGTPPHDYEYGCSFRRRLDEKLANTQSELAVQVGKSQGFVSKCLSMLELPSPILALLDDDPGLFGVSAAANIQALWKAHPEHTATIVEGVKRFKEGADQNGLKAWVAQQISRLNDEKKDVPNRIISNSSGNTAYVTIVKKRDITIRLADRNLDLEAHRDKIESFLRTLIQQESNS